MFLKSMACTCVVCLTLYMSGIVWLDSCFLTWEFIWMKDWKNFIAVLKFSVHSLFNITLNLNTNIQI